MTSYRNGAEGGAAGVAVTVANSGGASGAAFTATAGLTFKDDWASDGSKSFGVDAPGTASGIFRWADGGTSKTLRARLVRGQSAAFVGDHTLLRVTNAADSAELFRITGKSTGSLWLYNAAGTAVWQPAVALPTDMSKVRIEVRDFDSGTTTTDGTIRVAWWVGDATTPAADSGLITGNFGAGATIGQIRGGKYTSDNYTGNLRFDSLAVDTGTDAIAGEWIGAPATNSTASVIDTAGISDTITAAMTAVRAIAEAVAVTDLGGPQVMEIAESVDDPAAVTDSLEVILAAARTIADAAGVSDAVAGALGLARSITDTASASDVAVADAATVRGAADPGAIGDMVSVTLTAVRGASDQAGITDAVSAVLTASGAVQVEDQATASDTASTALAGVRGSIDTAGATDMATAVASAVRAEADTAGAGDQLMIVLASSRAVLDAGGATDAVTFLTATARTVEDGAVITDTVTAVMVGPYEWQIDPRRTCRVTDPSTVHRLGGGRTYRIRRAP